MTVFYLQYDMKFTFTLIFFLLFSIAYSQQYTVVDEGSEVGFTIRNFGVNVKGSFSGLEGEIVFDEKDLASSEFRVTVKANTVNTGIKRRDNHLNQEEYLDTEKHPLLQFISDKVTTSTDKDHWFIFGKLTIKGVTKEISFPFKAIKESNDYIFEGSFTINRRDFNVGGGSISMADELTVNLKVLAKSK